MRSHQKNCILTLKLSSPSFLDSVIQDDYERLPLYAIKTQGTTTVITRSDPCAGPVETSSIRWPLMKAKGRGRSWDGVQVRVKGGDWEYGERVLRHGSLLRYAAYFSVLSKTYSVLARPRESSIFQATQGHSNGRPSEAAIGYVPPSPQFIIIIS